VKSTAVLNASPLTISTKETASTTNLVDAAVAAIGMMVYVHFLAKMPSSFSRSSTNFRR
jgi:hypothetical protein